MDDLTLSNSLEQSEPEKPSNRGRKTPRNPYSRTGLIALKAKVKIRGLSAIDQRTLAAQDLIRWKEELVADLGGGSMISAQQRVIIDCAVRTRLLLDHLDSFVLEQPSLINKARRQVYPIVLQRQQLANDLVKFMTVLGLERRAKQITVDLKTYIQQKSATEPEKETAQ